MFFSRKVQQQITFEKDVPLPFFFKKTENGRMFVRAWTAELDKMKAVFYAVLERFPEIAGVLIKSIKSRDGEQITCDNYYGKNSLDRLCKVFKANEQYIFEDGNHQLYVRKLNSDEYLFLDDHGVFTINFKLADFEKVFLDAGFIEQIEKSISGLAHQHNTFKGADRSQAKIVAELSLKSI
jgi:hypothetical protein